MAIGHILAMADRLLPVLDLSQEQQLVSNLYGKVETLVVADDA